MAEPVPSLPPSELARYSRQILLEEIGPEGQGKLAAGRVLVIGAGGLGSPAALYLAAAGVGTLGIADFDRVELHNLHRQLLHDDRTIGKPKVESAAQRLRATNPTVKVVTHGEGVTPENALTLFREYDVVVDGTDNFGARYLNNDAAFFAARPLVYASVYKFEAQVTVFDTAAGGPCYRCLFPEPPPPGSVPDCGTAGVIGALCGVAGSLQAMEAIKLLTGIGNPLRGRLLTCHALESQFHTLALSRNADCPLCGPNPSIRGITSGAGGPATGTAESAAALPPDQPPLEISVFEAGRLRDASPERTLIIDVREPYELEICRIEGAEHIPMRQIPERADALPKDRHLLILCHSGGRSRRVTEFLRSRGFTRVSNISGGIDAWAGALDPAMRRY